MNKFFLFENKKIFLLCIESGDVEKENNYF